MDASCLLRLPLRLPRTTGHENFDNKKCEVSVAEATDAVQGVPAQELPTFCRLGLTLRHVWFELQSVFKN